MGVWGFEYRGRLPISMDPQPRRCNRVGTRLQPRGHGPTGLTVTVEGTRQEPAGQQPLNQGLQLHIGWGF